MATKDYQVLKEILAYRIHRRNESQVTVQELVQELSEKLRDMLEYSKDRTRDTEEEFPTD